MTALELAALAGISRILGEPLRHGEVSNHPEVSKGLESASMPQRPSIPQDDEVLAEIASMPEDEMIVESPSVPHAVLRQAQDDTVTPQDDTVTPQEDTVTPQREDKPDALEFLRGDDDAQARYYRACDEQIELLVAFLSDGRVRLIDTDGRRFAGMLETEKADLIEIGSNEWSRVFVSATPDGRTQLELQGGPHDTHVLICEALPG